MSFGMLQEKCHKILLIIGILISVQVLAEEPKGCEGCHSHEGIVSVADVDAATLRKCDQCHQGGMYQPNTGVHVTGNEKGFVRVSKPLSESLKQPEIPKPSEQPLARNAGMSVPLYYPQSRLGDAPNPMILIPAGEFIMGTNERLPDEGPQHKVTLGAYYIDKYEVSNLQYKKFNNATKRRSPRHFRNRTFPEGKADHPVVYVSWYDAKEYCEWVGKRLPTDQEWEKAARGTKGQMFPWGDTFDVLKANTPLRWQQIGLFGDTTPVGSFEAGKSPYGLYDVSGNVWEWTESWYYAYPGNKVASESYGERYKTLKGGSWFDCSFYNCGISAPVFNRAFFAPRTKNDSFGFRCAKDAK